VLGQEHVVAHGGPNNDAGIVGPTGLPENAHSELGVDSDDEDYINGSKQHTTRSVTSMIRIRQECHLDRGSE
jgi:hypothetical protein